MTISVSANNGTAPASALSPMPGRNGDGSQQMSPHTTAQSYARLRSAMLGAGMGDLLPSNGWSCYRDRAAQQHMRNIGLTTIPVGQSIHGEWTFGSAVDFANLGGFGAARHNWLRANAPAFGWYQPGWAQAGGSLPEAWHWEYDQRGDPHNGEDDDDMPSADEIAEAVWNFQITQFQVGGGPGPGPAWAWLGDARIAAMTVWDTSIGPRSEVGVGPGPGPARDWLADARNSAGIAVQQTATLETGTFSSGRDLWVFALVLLLAIVGGVAIGLSTTTHEGVVTGVAAVVGGLLTVLFRNLPGDHGHHGDHTA